MSETKSTLRDMLQHPFPDRISTITGLAGLAIVSIAGLGAVFTQHEASEQPPAHTQLDSHHSHTSDKS